MDWGMILASVGLSLVSTSFGYLFVPTILALAGKKYEVKKLKRINIINCVIVWILFRILQIALGDDPSSGAAVFLWGAVGHWILKKHCLKDKNTTPVPVSTPTAQPSQVHVCLSDKDELPHKYGNYNVYGSDIALKQDTEQPKVNPESQESQTKAQPIQTQTPVIKQAVKRCSRCGNVIDPVTNKCKGCAKQHVTGITVNTFIIIMLCIFLVASFAMNVILCSAHVSLKEEYDKMETANSSKIVDLEFEIQDLKNTNTALQSQLQINTEKVNFFNNYIVVVEDDGTNLYHKYGCNKFIGDSFWAFNTEAAKSKGYSPCPLCCG